MSTLLVPELSPGRGTGHLRRCISLLEVLPDSFLLLPERVARFSALIDLVPEDRIVCRADSRSVDWIICDRFDLPRQECRELRKHGLVIGLDAGGSGRRECDFLLDTLPRLSGCRANLESPGARVTPVRTRVLPRGAGRILVTFGGEDPARLTERVCAEISGYSELDPASVTVVLPAARDARVPGGFQVTRAQPSLEPLFETHAMVITSFGLTALEAQTAGCRVMLVQPTHYHRRLADQVGFVSAGVRRVNRRIMRAFCSGNLDGSRELAPSTPTLIGSLLSSLGKPELSSCPLHKAESEVVFRTPQKTYRRCSVCGLVFLEAFVSDSQDYGTDYFMDEYAAQYGRTYLEDFDHIRAMGNRRASIIRDIVPSASTLLDIGCAYGPFLEAANDAGFSVSGIDISREPVSYVQKELGFHAVAGDFRSNSVIEALANRRFDVVSMWYVIEHFPDLADVLSRLATLVAPGGIVALATPHGGGVSARREPQRFFTDSPRDHYTIWDRNSARRVLCEYGFKVERFVVTGHHPERYPLVRAGILPQRIASALSRVAGWGDTFEIYARRLDQRRGEFE